MSMTDSELAQLVAKVALMIPQPSFEFVPPTGEVLSHEAMELARVYDRMSPPHRTVLNWIADGFRRKYSRG